MFLVLALQGRPQEENLIKTSRDNVEKGNFEAAIISPKPQVLMQNQWFGLPALKTPTFSLQRGGFCPCSWMEKGFSGFPSKKGKRGPPFLRKKKKKTLGF
jgi:hypothetical protein